MGNAAIAADDPCSHRGGSLWSSHWEAWCTQCGVTMRFPELISDVRAHDKGDVYETT